MTSEPELEAEVSDGAQESKTWPHNFRIHFRLQTLEAQIGVSGQSDPDQMELSGIRSVKFDLKFRISCFLYMHMQPFIG